MRYRKIYLFVILFFIGCSSPENKEKSSSENIHNVQNENETTEEWDKHQFYDDLEFTTLDSLGTVIQLADSIVAYNWNANDGNPANVYHHIVDAYGKFDDRIGKNLLLNESQKTSLKKLITDSTNYEGSNAICFIPHIAFVYYYESEIIGQSNVCFLCSGVKSVPKSTTALSDKGNTELKEYCKEIGLEIMDDESQLSH